MKKQWIVYLLILTSCVILASCGKSDNNETGEASPGATSDSVQPPDAVVDIQPSASPESKINGSELLKSMTGYQAYCNVKTGTTTEDDIKNIFGKQGTTYVDAAQGGDEYSKTVSYKIEEDLEVRLYLNKDSIVYKKQIVGNIPEEYRLQFTKEDFEKMDKVKSEQGAVSYETVTSELGGDGFLTEEYLRNDGTVVSNYRWYNESGHDLSAILVDGQIKDAFGYNMIKDK